MPRNAFLSHVQVIAIGLAVLLTLVWLPPTLAAERNIGLSEKQVPDAAPISERRVALVVGNSQYSFSPLRNPVNDASSMAGATGRPRLRGHPQTD